MFGALYPEPFLPGDGSQGFDVEPIKEFALFSDAELRDPFLQAQAHVIKLAYEVTNAIMSLVYKYLEIAQNLTARIEWGTLKPGDRLPSVAELREEFDASYGSIRSAILIMKAKGLVYGKHGVGVFVTKD